MTWPEHFKNNNLHKGDHNRGVTGWSLLLTDSHQHSALCPPFSASPPPYLSMQLSLYLPFPYIRSLHHPLFLYPTTWSLSSLIPAHHLSTYPSTFNTSTRPSFYHLSTPSTLHALIFPCTFPIHSYTPEHNCTLNTPLI